MLAQGLPAAALRMVIERELTPEQIRDAYEGGQRLFTNVELIGTGEFPSLLNVNLSGAEFADCWFHSTAFTSVDFSRTKFVRCNLKCSTFANCDLRGSTWSDCSVCSIAIAASLTTDIAVSGLEAYGAAIESPSAFLVYASKQAGGLRLATHCHERKRSLRCPSVSKRVLSMNASSLELPLL